MKVNDIFSLVLFSLQFSGYAVLSGLAVSEWVKPGGLGGGVGRGVGGTGVTLI